MTPAGDGKHLAALGIAGAEKGNGGGDLGKDTVGLDAVDVSGASLVEVILDSEEVFPVLGEGVG